ncbi:MULTISPECIES: RNA polymerase sigma factor [unclassified Lentimicrobium]|uniref:RNA polymerase sigma factor n=1 Tax=unclassified Lentimicrobium TaxID=2677434 RepID=UPI0015534C32|nr:MULTISPECIES: sigma-70 family RNA polymerase sigma factor [unclassified Lentimicrobium]NPD46875.1 sigma-70 family RNA polymerase sigma factor [Lentimicrobium sp. S6]NPD84458.1 sigma-70 family RNA polymerase sigma factor [Lentimicrobium sp. L6]
MNALTPSDKELIRDYLNGRESSLEKIILRHKDKLYAYIFTMVKCHQTTDDIFQDTFIKVINTLKMGTYNEEGKFIHWVTRIAHNLIIDHFRRNNRMPIQSQKDDQDPFERIYLPSPSVEDLLIEEQIHKDVKALVEELPADQKEVLKMRHYMGMSFKDIADSTDVSINTALGRMRYAIINLRKFASERDIILTR